MAEQMIGFLDHLERFFLSDDDARWKAMRWIIFVVGVCGSLDLAAFDDSLDNAVFLMGILALIMSVSWITWYCTFDPHQTVRPLSASRRSLVLQALSSTFAFLVFETMWRLQASALTSDLVQAAKSEDYEKAADVFERARTVGVRLDRRVATDVGLGFINAMDHPQAWNAVLASVDYKSFLDAQTVHRGTANRST